jgi:hypothetical protein
LTDILEEKAFEGNVFDQSANVMDQQWDLTQASTAPRPPHEMTRRGKPLPLGDILHSVSEFVPAECYFDPSVSRSSWKVSGRWSQNDALSG